MYCTPESLESLKRQAKGIKCIFPKAPTRTINWPSGKERNVISWYNYYSDNRGIPDVIELRHFYSQVRRIQQIVRREISIFGNFRSLMDTRAQRTISDDIFKYANERKILYEVSKTIIDSGDLTHYSNVCSIEQAYEIACKKNNVEPLNTSFINKNTSIQIQWITIHDSLIHEAYMEKAKNIFEMNFPVSTTGNTTHVIWKGSEAFPGQQEQFFHMMEARKVRKKKQISSNDVRTYMEGYNKMKLAFQQWVESNLTE